MPGGTAAILQPRKQKPLTSGWRSGKVKGAEALDDIHKWLNFPLTPCQVRKTPMCSSYNS